MIPFHGTGSELRGSDAEAAALVEPVHALLIERGPLGPGEIASMLGRNNHRHTLVVVSRALHQLRGRGRAYSAMTSSGPGQVWYGLVPDADESRLPVPALDAELVLVSTDLEQPYRHTLVRTVAELGASWPAGTTLPALTMAFGAGRHATAAERATARERALATMTGRLEQARGVPAAPLPPAPPAPVAAPAERPILPRPPRRSRQEPDPMPVRPSAPVTLELRRGLLAYLASIEGGARADTAHGWLKSRGVARADAEQLLEDLTARGEVEQSERAAAGGTIVVRYRVVDPAVRPAPLPASDAPPAELAAAPARAPEEPPPPSLAPVAAQVPAPLSPEVPDVPAPPADRPTPTEPAEEPALVAQPEEPRRNASVTPAPSEPPPASAPRLVTPAAPARAPGGLLAAFERLPGEALEQLARQGQELRVLDQSIEAARRELALLEATIAAAEQRRAGLRSSVAALLGEAPPAPAPSVERAFVAMVEEMAGPVAPVLPGPAKAPAPALVLSLDGRSQRDRVLLVMPERNEMRGIEVSKAADLPAHSTYALLSRMAAAGLLEPTGSRGVYRLTAAGRRERAALLRGEGQAA